jgi:MYND finger
MREVNFSIPSANKASVGITPALYDRRALDTTSTLPLINSLNNLAYLTTSSARIRDILTVDGGVERLVCILKDGRSKDLMDGWKWNLAFQCIVNIGVRGSEQVRTRVVEADMVPVIATVLENYVQVIDKCRQKLDAEQKRAQRQQQQLAGSSSNKPSKSHGSKKAIGSKHAPPRIDIPASQALASSSTQRHPPSNDQSDSIPNVAMSSPPERTTFARHFHRNSMPSVSEPRDDQMPGIRPTLRLPADIPPALGSPALNNTTLPDLNQETLAIRPVRDIDRLPSMIPLLQAEFTQPESPTTPSGVLHLPHPSIRGSPSRTTRRPSIRHQLSISNRSDIVPEDDSPDESAVLDPATVVDLQTDINMQGVDVQVNDVAVSPVALENPVADSTGVDTLELARSALEGGNTNAQTQQGEINIPGTAPRPSGSSQHVNAYIRTFQERPGPISCMPRDEDVLMCLQLLAYVSKYCGLRCYFQKTHLVPRLKTPANESDQLERILLGQEEFNCSDDHEMAASLCGMDEDDLSMEEYLQPDDFNIFPLVEKFTVRHHSADMQYWARVVMRNLCRKDDSRGGIRQCAYYQCGKWEQYTREFAKCRRCRRTKYCSKECQKLAWVYHRHWCVEATT